MNKVHLKTMKRKIGFDKHIIYKLLNLKIELQIRKIYGSLINCNND